MEYLEFDIKAQNFWNELSVDEKVKLLSNNGFWDGFKTYKYQYLPEDLQTILRLNFISF
jgi:hypothetical protein